MVSCDFLHHGLNAWKLQRRSAIFLAIYAIALFAFWLPSTPHTLAQWQAFLLHPAMEVLGALALLSFVAHAWVGLTTVVTDYIKPQGMQVLFYRLVVLVCLLYVVAGVWVLWVA